MSKSDFNRNGLVLYEGPSAIDGEPIVVIATGLKRKSGNDKTGAMIQTWILRADMDPVTALKTGSDVSICGGCIHRPKEADGDSYRQRSCYVNVVQAPLNVWKTWKRGRYATADFGDLPAIFADRVVRLGSYGDPAAAPVGLWAAVTMSAASWTGYTHQWRNAKLRGVLEWCQISADSCQDLDRAEALGIRAGSFRVRPLDPSHPDHALRPEEIVCPASEEAGKVADCASCRMCNGADGKPVAILAHGIGKTQYTGRKVRAA